MKLYRRDIAVSRQERAREDRLGNSIVSKKPAAPFPTWISITSGSGSVVHPRARASEIYARPCEQEGIAMRERSMRLRFCLSSEAKCRVLDPRVEVWWSENLRQRTWKRALSPVPSWPDTPLIAYWLKGAPASRISLFRTARWPSSPHDLLAILTRIDDAPSHFYQRHISNL